METRLKRWKQYRDSIYSNINLSNEVIKSNEKLQLLYNRLIKVLPKYNELFPEPKIKKIKFEEVKNYEKYDIEKMKELIEKMSINKPEYNFDYLNNVNISMGELEFVISEIESFDSSGISIRDSYNTNKIVIRKVKKIEL